MLNIIEINFYTRSIDFILNVLYLQKKKNKIEYLPITKKSKIETKIITHPRFHATKNPRKISRHRSSRSWLEESIEYIEHVPGTFTLSEIIRYFFFFFFLFLSAPSTTTCIAFTCIDPYTRVCQRKLFPLTYESGQTIHCKSGMGS